jgi:DNA-binding transcriptional MerR regulator
MDNYVETTGSLAKKADVTAETVRAYCALGLLEHVRLDNGTRLFRTSAVATVRRIKAKNMAAPRHRAREVAA